MAADWQERLKGVPHEPGVYIHRDRVGSVIYVGKAKDLRKRLSYYFSPAQRRRADRKTAALMDSIVDFETHSVRNEQEALLLEGKLIKQYRPRYNVNFKDDKRFFLVRYKVEETWPSFVAVRVKKEDGAKYLGPFAHGPALKATVDWLNREFGLKACKPLEPGETEFKHCHANLIRNCSAPCVGKIEREEYVERFMEALTLLTGRGKRERMASLKAEMAEAAEKLNFEKAGRLRDIIGNLTITLTPTRQFSRGRGVPTTVRPVKDLAELGEILSLPEPPRVMECFDISNISDTHIVASMVRFKNGLPDNQNYRRYRIKSVAGQDDFASMAEVVRRRYARVLDEKKSNKVNHVQVPDLVIVDGGKGQLGMAWTEMKRLGLEGVPLIGLAKREEEIFVAGEAVPIAISHERGALKLLQRIRDEAHRTANGYNELLMRRRMKESALDDCPGISVKKKEALLKAFGSVQRLKKASVADISALPGFSKITAERILEWLL